MLINEDPSVNTESRVINTDLEQLLLVLGVLQLSTLAYTSYHQLRSLHTQDGERSERMYRYQQRISRLNPFLEGFSFFFNPIYLAMSIQDDGSLDNRHGPNLPNVAYINIVIPMLLFLGNLCYDWGDPH